MKANAQFPEEQSDDGEFKRQEDAFRAWVTDDGSSPHPVACGRYHLYVSLACPWACRTLIVRKIKRLEEAIGVTVVDPIRDEWGWAFRDGPGHTIDPVNGFQFLREAYVATNPKFNGRVTVPVLWDKKARLIVNNSEDDICRMFNGVFGQLCDASVDLFPADIAREQDELSAFIYENVNNGVYKAGFADTQQAYEKAARALFGALDQLEARLATRRYLFGARIVETDWRLFSTLVRFDAVYHGHFKCNLRRIVDYPNLDAYLRDLYQQPGIAETVNFDHIKRHYYVTHDDINPTRIVPIGPLLDLNRPHGREARQQHNEPVMKAPGLRSDYEKVGGIVFFGRMLDKIRLQAAGRLPSGYNTGTADWSHFDSRCTRFLRVDYQDVAKRVLQGGTDEEILDWCFEQGRRPSLEEIEIWNEFLTKRGWRDGGSAELAEVKRMRGFANRKDIQTWFDFHKADEESDDS